MSAIEGQPRISVLLPVRDLEEHIENALHDLRAACGARDEILVIDDGSSDSTPAILTRIAKSEPRLRVVTTGGVGLVGALNLGLREAQHDWVARADGDDRYPIDRLTAQRQAIKPGVVLVTGDYEIWGDGQFLGRIPCALTSAAVKLSLMNPQRIPHPGVLIHRPSVLKVGGYREEEFPTEDLGLWIRLSLAGEWVGVPERVLMWHLRKESISGQSRSRQRRQVVELRGQVKDALASHLRLREVLGELRSVQQSSWACERLILLARDLISLGTLGARVCLLLTLCVLAINPFESLQAWRRLLMEKSKRNTWRFTTVHQGGVD